MVIVYFSPFLGLCCLSFMDKVFLYLIVTMKTSSTDVRHNFQQACWNDTSQRLL